MGISTYEGRVILFNNGVVDVKQGDVSLVDSERVAHIPEGNVSIDNLTIIKNAEQELEVPFDNNTIYRDSDGFIKARNSGETYTAGEHITIDSENVISAEWPEVSDHKVILCTKVGDGVAGPVGSFTLNQNSDKTITIPIPEPEVKEYTGGTDIEVTSEGVINYTGSGGGSVEIDNKSIIRNSEGKLETAIGGKLTVHEYVMTPWNEIIQQKGEPGDEWTVTYRGDHVDAPEQMVPDYRGLTIVVNGEEHECGYAEEVSENFAYNNVVYELYHSYDFNWEEYNPEWEPKYIHLYIGQRTDLSEMVPYDCWLVEGDLPTEPLHIIYEEHEPIDMKYIKVNPYGALVCDNEYGIGIVTDDKTIYVDNGELKANIPTPSTPGNGLLTINQGGTEKGRFYADQRINTTIDLNDGSVDIDNLTIVENSEGVIKVNPEGLRGSVPIIHVDQVVHTLEMTKSGNTYTAEGWDYGANDLMQYVSDNKTFRLFGSDCYFYSDGSNGYTFSANGEYDEQTGEPLWTISGTCTYDENNDIWTVTATTDYNFGTTWDFIDEPERTIDMGDDWFNSGDRVYAYKCKMWPFAIDSETTILVPAFVEYEPLSHGDDVVFLGTRIGGKG